MEAPVDVDREDAAAAQVLRARAADPEAVDALAEFLAAASAPALVVGAGADDPETWAALIELAERLAAPVFQESFGARAGFPQDHRLFAGFLPADRPHLREKLAQYDAILVGGATGLRMALPDRPVVAVVGDGSSLYGIQALWTAAHYGVRVLLVILSNGGYAIPRRRRRSCRSYRARKRAVAADTVAA